MYFGKKKIEKRNKEMQRVVEKREWWAQILVMMWKKLFILENNND